MARVIHRDGAKTCSVGGKTYSADAGGVFDVPDEHLPMLFESHRFAPAPPQVSVDQPKRKGR